MRKSDKKKEARTSVKGDKKAEVVSPARSNTNAAAKPVNAALTAPPAMQITVGGNKFALTHGLLVNNPEYADVSVILAPSGGKKETLAAHEAFLSFRGVSGLLSAPSALCSKIEKKGGHTTAVVSESALAFCNSAILLAVLRFVYTSDVKSVESSDDLAFLVNLLATVVAAGLGESYLARVVEDRVSSLTTLATAHTLIARTYDYKLDRLHYHTRSFAFRNWNAFISDKDGCRKLGVELLSKLSAANAKGETEIAPTFPVPALQDKILTDLAGMVASANGTADVAIECGKDSFAPAHRAVLATVCEGFRSDLIQAAVSSPKQRKSTSGKLEVSFASNNGADSLSVAGANALLQFVYFGNSAITAPVAVNLILALSDYKIASLEAACELAIQEFDLHTAFPILGITFHPNWVTRPTSGLLRKNVTDFIVANFKDLDLNVWADLPPVLFHALQAVQRAHQQQSSDKVAVAAPTASVAQTLESAKPSLPTPPPPLATRAASESIALDAADLPPPPPALPSKPKTFVAEEEEEDEVDDSSDGPQFFANSK